MNKLMEWVTKKQQASNSILSLIAQKYSLNLSNENHIKNAEKIKLFVNTHPALFLLSSLSQIKEMTNHKS